MQRSNGAMLLDEVNLFEQIDGTEPEPEDNEESINNPFDPTAIRVASRPSTIDLLVSRIKHGELDLAPTFQRNPR